MAGGPGCAAHKLSGSATGFYPRRGCGFWTPLQCAHVCLQRDQPERHTGPGLAQPPERRWGVVGTSWVGTGATAGAWRTLGLRVGEPLQRGVGGVAELAKKALPVSFLHLYKAAVF